MWLSVIVPVYNVEKYIRRCIESIYCQGLSDDEFELILVNDGTPDKSFEVISDIISQHSNITIIEQQNQGLSVARNKGASIAKGTYILFVDSDDLLRDNCLSIILEKAILSSADMIIADYVKMADEDIEHLIPPKFSVDYHTVAMSGREAFLYFFNPKQCFVWRTLYRKAFIDKFHLEFIPGIYFEDIPFTTNCYLHSNQVILLNIPFYIYRQHYNSTVSSINCKKLLDINKVITYLWSLQDSETLKMKERQKLVDTVFETFSVEMWYLTHEKHLFGYKKEVVEDLKRKVPNLSFKNGFKQKLVSFMFANFPYMYIWLRSL